jgi:hypothetical protein
VKRKREKRIGEEIGHESGNRIFPHATKPNNDHFYQHLGLKAFILDLFYAPVNNRQLNSDSSDIVSASMYFFLVSNKIFYQKSWTVACLLEHFSMNFGL